MKIQFTTSEGHLKFRCVHVKKLEYRALSLSLSSLINTHTHTPNTAYETQKQINNTQYYSTLQHTAHLFHTISSPLSLSSILILRLSISLISLFSSFFYFSFFLPFIFLPSIYPSFLHSFLPYFHLFLTSFFPSFRPSFLPFVPSIHPTFLLYPSDLQLLV